MNWPIVLGGLLVLGIIVGVNAPRFLPFYFEVALLCICCLQYFQIGGDRTNISALQAQVSSLSTRAANLSTQATTITNQKSDLSKQVSALKTQELSLFTQVTTLTNRNVFLDKQVLDLETRANSERRELTSRLSKLQADLDAALEQNSSLRTAFELMPREIRNLTDDNAQLRAQLQEKIEQVRAVVQAKATLQTMCDENVQIQHINRLNGELTRMREAYQNLETELRAASEENRSLFEEAQHLRPRINIAEDIEIIYKVEEIADLLEIVQGRPELIMDELARKGFDHASIQRQLREAAGAACAKRVSQLHNGIVTHFSSLIDNQAVIVSQADRKIDEYSGKLRGDGIEQEHIKVMTQQYKTGLKWEEKKAFLDDLVQFRGFLGPMSNA